MTALPDQGTVSTSGLADLDALVLLSSSPGASLSLVATAFECITLPAQILRFSSLCLDT